MDQAEDFSAQSNNRYFFGFWERQFPTTFQPIVPSKFRVSFVVPICGAEELVQFSTLFSQTVTKELSEGHLWYSIVTRPVTSRFTRFERVACCLLLLLLFMITTAMFYRNEGPYVQTNLLTIGPFAITLREVTNNRDLR
ncbi:unnamed protein product [Protopolystoma xenopodis]|uniref:Polycystin domain-containing protein n=1 Tax=Protopolystoma xenopodis TaxID=117903 RepID=A0A3S5CIJ5_9PLAT|nr:unnamed protein product [Protopolystoma xenopodis]